MDEKAPLTGVMIWGIRFSIEPEAVLRDYLVDCLRRKRHIKIAPVTMRELWKIFLFPRWRSRFQKLDIVYPESSFACRSFFNLNPLIRKNRSVEKMIYSHRLVLDLIEETFKQHYPLIFVGMNENQKNNLQRTIRSLFSEVGDVCFLHPEMTRLKPYETADWLNLENFGLVILSSNSGKVKNLVLEKCRQSLIYFDRTQFLRYLKDWRKKPSWYSFKGLMIGFFGIGKIFLSAVRWFLGLITLYYPLQGLFSIVFWVFSVIINKNSKKHFTFTV